MRHTIRFEWIGRNGRFKNPAPWLARILAWEPGHVEREFLKPQMDFSRSNGPATRGVFVYFHVPDGLYESECFVKWKQRERNYFLCCGGQCERIKPKEILESFKAVSGHGRPGGGETEDSPRVRHLPEGVCELFRRKGLICDDAPCYGGGDSSW